MELERRKLEIYSPHPKQIEFHAAGARVVERCLLAANQSGKSTAGAAEVAMHLTGRYPPWWTGRVFAEPTRWWCAGESGESTRDTPQRLLFGSIGHLGTGFIPHGDIISVSPARGVADLLDHAEIRHTSGRSSFLKFKTYGKGRENWASETLDGIWADEELELGLYSEGLVRLQARNGLMMVTMTPLLGQTALIRRLTIDEPPGSSVTRMTLDDALHYSPEERKLAEARIPEHERDARIRAIPFLGSGLVFLSPEADICCEPFAIPAHWPLLGAMDMGWDHPTAAVKIAWDRDTDIAYVIAEYRQSRQLIYQHASRLRAWGKGLPWAWPHDALKHDPGSGEEIANQYRDHLLNMLPKHATFPEGGYGFEAGIELMRERLELGTLKIFSSCVMWFEEYRQYHRKDGLVQKIHDDLLSATRIGMMSLRHASVAAKTGEDYNKFMSKHRREWV